MRVRRKDGILTWAKWYVSGVAVASSAAHSFPLYKKPTDQEKIWKKDLKKFINTSRKRHSNPGAQSLLMASHTECPFLHCLQASHSTTVCALNTFHKISFRPNAISLERTRMNG